MKMNDWNVIVTFMYPHEAHMAKNILESEGVNVLIKDEMTVQVNNFYSNAVGGVKLLVEQEDREKAFAILREAGYIKDADPAKTEKGVNTGRLKMFPYMYSSVCPYCQSDNVSKKRLPGYVFVCSILLLGLPLPFIKRTCYCFDCGKEWRVSVKHRGTKK